MLLAIAELAIAAYGAYEASQQSSAAADAAAAAARAQQDSIDAQSRAANVRAQQERVKVQREARIARAQVLASTATSGIGQTSSAVSGATGSIVSQEAAGIGAINVAQDFGTQASVANQRAAVATGEISARQGRAAQWQQISGTAFSLFNQEGGFKTIFSKPIASAKP